MASLFDIKEHLIEAQHIREYPRATAHSQEEVLQVSVKQYTPKSNPNPQPGDVTIIGAHANGFPRELYEALWEDLLRASTAHGFRIRSIWITDIAWQGKSGIINEHKLGNDPSWVDASRDLLHMTNVFRREMPRPIFGVGHSFGAAIVTNLSLMHPRLLSALVLIDPVICHHASMRPAHGADPMALSAGRRDLWPSRRAAADAFARTAFYRAWDPRVLDTWVRHGLRDCPTALHRDASPGSVTLSTTKHQEVFTYLRPRRQGLNPKGQPAVMDRSKIRDIEPAQLDTQPEWEFYQPESAATFEKLPRLLPAVLYIHGGDSDLGAPRMRRERVAATGVGVGGSGGVAQGRVVDFVVEGVGHLVPMVAPGVCAEQAAGWIGKEMRRWRREEEELARWWGRPDGEKAVLDDAWRALIPAVNRPKL